MEKLEEAILSGVGPRLYDDLAWLWPWWGDPDGDYADWCTHVSMLFQFHAARPLERVLDIGCGGGKNVYNLKNAWQVEGLDLSMPMLNLARVLNPDCTFHCADLRTFELESRFDGILLDDAIAYVLTPADLAAAFRQAHRHLHPGGVMVVAPDHTRESFAQNQTIVAQGEGANKPEGLEVVYIQNNFDPDPDDDDFEATMVYLIREQGRLRVETDRHLFGLFSIDLWRQLLRETGFDVHEISFDLREELFTTFACVKVRE